MAQCPKCKAKIGVVTGTVISIPSSCDRNPEGNAGIIYGRSCIICGYYQDIVEIVQPKVPETPKSLARPSGPRSAIQKRPEHNKHSKGASLKLREDIAAHIQAIRELHRFGAQSSVICRMLVKNGCVASDKTLRKHYRAILGG
jgi:hypothetical protein